MERCPTAAIPLAAEFEVAVVAVVVAVAERTKRLPSRTMMTVFWTSV